MCTLEGAAIKPLHFNTDQRGRLMEILRRDDPFFVGFGQVYITTAYPGIVKAWHYHRVQTDHFAVLKGMARVVLYDGRENSSTFGTIEEFCIGDFNPLLIQIPPLVIHGFATIGTEEAILLNCPTEPYNREEPDEYRIDVNANIIPYSWQSGR